ncbi:hypothetical protein PROFUN_11118 [Planoprotostelium fungivorum]|uniref:Pentatricopeptide repeat-containing protein n=1 Tax=Planoprotostelium fungivorum TaxID=1890364 RepID=A0A2P6NAR1_9EUKA|nr:hypothetical protein PROFUN_11118 [Planoprotostelium fungivorum]
MTIGVSCSKLATPARSLLPRLPCIRPFPAFQRFSSTDVEVERRIPTIIREKIQKIQSLGKRGDTEGLERLWNEMHEDNLDFSATVYSAALKVYGQLGDIARVDSLWKEMIDKSIEPDLSVYNILIDAYAFQKKSEKVVEAWKKLIEDGLEPNAHTYQSIVEMYAELNDSEMLQYIRTEMKEKSFEWDVDTYNAVIKYHMYRNETKQGVELINEMRSKQVQPNTETFRLESKLREMMRCRAPEQDGLELTAEEKNGRFTTRLLRVELLIYRSLHGRRQTSPLNELETQTHIFIDCPAKDIWNEQWKKTRITLGFKHRLNIFQPDDKDPKYNPPWDPRYLGLVPKDVKRDTPQSNQYSTTQHKGKQHTLLPAKRHLAEQRTTPPPTTAEPSEEFQKMGYLVLNSLRPKPGRAFQHKSGKLWAHHGVLRRPPHDPANCSGGRCSAFILRIRVFVRSPTCSMPGKYFGSLLGIGGPNAFLHGRDSFVIHLNRDNYVLHRASAIGFKEGVQMLLADPRLDLTMDGKALQHAIARRQIETALLLLSCDRIDPAAESNLAIQTAARYGVPQLVRVLLADPRVDPSDRNNKAIRSACKRGCQESLKLLMADPRVDPSLNSNAALCIAIDEDMPDIQRLLLSDARVRKNMEEEHDHHYFLIQEEGQKEEEQEEGDKDEKEAEEEGTMGGPKGNVCLSKGLMVSDSNKHCQAVLKSGRRKGKECGRLALITFLSKSRNLWFATLVHPESKEFPPYRIENMTPMSLVVYQRVIERIDPYHAISHTWDEPSTSHGLIVEVIDGEGLHARCNESHKPVHIQFNRDRSQQDTRVHEIAFIFILIALAFDSTQIHSSSLF